MRIELVFLVLQGISPYEVQEGGTIMHDHYGVELMMMDDLMLKFILTPHQIWFL